MLQILISILIGQIDQPEPMDGPSTGWAIATLALGMMSGGTLVWMKNLRLYSDPTNPESWYVTLYQKVQSRLPADDGLYIKAARFIALISVFFGCTVVALGIWLIIISFIEGIL